MHPKPAKLNLFSSISVANIRVTARVKNAFPCRLFIIQPVCEGLKLWRFAQKTCRPRGSKIQFRAGGLTFRQPSWAPALSPEPYLRRCTGPVSGRLKGSLLAESVPAIFQADRLSAASQPEPKLTSRLHFQRVSPFITTQGCCRERRRRGVGGELWYGRGPVKGQCVCPSPPPPSAASFLLHRLLRI